MKRTTKLGRFTLTITPTVIAVLLLAAGVALIAFPTAVTGTVLRVIAAAVLVAELWHAIPILARRAFTPLTVITLGAELTVAVAALILLFNPIGAISLLSIIFGLYVAATSAFSLIKLKLSGARGVRYIFPSVTLAIGILLVFFPKGAIELTVTVVGAVAILYAVILLIGEYGKRCPKKPQRGDPLINAEYRDISDE